MRFLTIIKQVLHFLWRIFVAPCDGCVHQEDCVFLKENGCFCGDIGFSFYKSEEAMKGDEE